MEDDAYIGKATCVDWDLDLEDLLVEGFSAREIKSQDDMEIAPPGKVVTWQAVICVKGDCTMKFSFRCAQAKNTRVGSRKSTPLDLGLPFP
jgi:hypothetical protein